MVLWVCHMRKHAPSPLPKASGFWLPGSWEHLLQMVHKIILVGRVCANHREMGLEVKGNENCTIVSLCFQKVQDFGRQK